MKHLKSYKLFEKKVPKSERINIFRDEKYILVAPLTESASCKYGAYSNWCTSAPGSGAWRDDINVEGGTILLILIQRGLVYSQEREEKIWRYKFLNDELENGEGLSESEEEEMYELYNDSESEDLSKIAFTSSGGRLEIWANNNVDLSDKYYTPNDLPLDDYITEEIVNYFDENS